jgi:transcriptional regulator with XRE-family HTH domain
LENEIIAAFGRTLRKLRLESGQTQEQMGLEADLQRKYISLLELGERQPTITSLFKLAAALKIKPSKLVQHLEKELEDK